MNNPTDFNDLAKLESLEAVRLQIESAVAVIDQAQQEAAEAPNDCKHTEDYAAVSCDAPDLLTDQRIKHYFSKIYQKIVQYVPGIGWHFWDGCRWCTGLPGGLHPLIDKMQRNLLKESSKIKDEKKRLERRQELIKLESHNRQLTLIQAFQNVPDLITVADQLDREAMFLNCRNGTVDLTTGNLKKHNPADLITRIVNIEFDHAAVCPSFLQFIAWAMQDDEELVGYGNYRPHAHAAHATAKAYDHEH